MTLERGSLLSRLGARLDEAAAKRRAPSRREAFCSIATRDFLPWALVLFDALRRHHPRAAQVLLYVRREGEPDNKPIIEGVEVITAADLIDPQAEQALRARFTIPEFCFSLKPSLLQHLLQRHGERAYYLDSDIDVQGPLTQAGLALERASVVLTPHLDAPIPLDGKSPSPVAILRAGAHNLGFIGVAGSPEAQAVLEWWKACVMTWGYVRPEYGYQGDQKWMDLAHSLFSDVALLRDPGSNVAYWNLHSRALSRTEAGLRVNGQPLAFVHFSGFDPRAPQVLSKYQNRIAESQQPLLMELARDFAARIVRAGEREAALRWTQAPAVQAPPRVSTASGAWPAEAYRGSLQVTYFQTRVETFERAPATVVITNGSAQTWNVASRADGGGAVYLSYHVFFLDGVLHQFENDRFPLPHDLAPGESIEMQIQVRAPHNPGRFLIEFDLVRENEVWFSHQHLTVTRHELQVGLFL